MTSQRPANYDKYIASSKWRNIASAMKKHGNFTCQRCKNKFHPGELDVHHRNYDSFGNERMSDLEVLCHAKCHPIADAQRVEQVIVRRERRQNDAATHTFLSKKYGDNYASFAHEGMYEEFEDWLAKKRYGEFGEW